MPTHLVEGTDLGSVKERKRLWKGGTRRAGENLTTPSLRWRAWSIPTRAPCCKRYEEEVEAVESKNAERIARVRFAYQGRTTYPDATFTLRLSFGQVKGWDKNGPCRHTSFAGAFDAHRSAAVLSIRLTCPKESRSVKVASNYAVRLMRAMVKGWDKNGAPVPPFTTFAGAFERATGAPPFALPPSWKDAKDHLNLAQHLDFVTTNDVIGGNSGSPVINQDGQIVGLIFDGNLESLGGAFWFDGRSNRAVAVSSSAIVEALQKIYQADGLVMEINGS